MTDRSYEFGIKVTADGRVAVTEFGRVREAEAAVGEGARRAAGQMAELEAASGRVSGALRSVAAAGAAVVGGLGFAHLTREAIAAADATTNLASRIRLVTEGATAQAVAQQRIFEIARSTHQSLAATGDLYFKMAKGGEALNMNLERVLGLTLSVSQAMALSGASAESSKAAIMQFGQALASGALRGDELNSVMEQAPALAEAIAKGMGKTTGELRALGEQGKITVQEIVAALEKQAPEIARQFAQVSLTVASAWQDVGTAAAKWVGDADRSRGASRALAEAIAALARNFDTVAAVTAGVAVVMTGRLAGAIATAVAGKIALANASRQAAAAQLAEAQAAHATVFIAARMAQGQAANAAATAALATATGNLVAAQTAASTGAMLARGAMAALGGPIGMVTTALTLGATAWALWGSSAKSAVEEGEEAARKVAALAAKSGLEELEVARTMRAEARRAYEDEKARTGEEFGALWDKWYTLDALVLEIETREKNRAARLADASAGESWKKLYMTPAEQKREAIEELDKLYTTEAQKLAGSQDKLLQLTADYHRKRAAIEKKFAEKSKHDDIDDIGRVQAKEYARLVGASQDWVRQTEAEIAAGEKLSKGEQLLLEAKQQLPPALAEEIEKILGVTIARDKAREAAEALRKEAEKRIEDLYQTAEALEAENKKIREHNEEIGLTKEQLARLRDERMAAAIAAKEQELASLGVELQCTAETEALKEQIAALRERRALLGQGAALEAGAEAARESQEAWKKNWEEVDRLSRQAFADMVHGGRDAAERIGDAVKSAVLNAIYEATLRPIVFQVYANVAGALGVPVSSTMPGGSGGVGNLLSLGNNAFGGSLYNNFATSAFGQAIGLSSAASLIAPTGALAAMGGGTGLLAGAGGVTGLSFGGGVTGLTAAAAPATIGSVTPALTTLGSALPYVGLALGALALFGGDLFGGEEATPEMGFSQYRRGTTWGDRYGERVDAGDQIYRETPFGIVRLAGQHLDSIGGNGVMADLAKKYLDPVKQLDTAIAAWMSENEVSAVAAALDGWLPGEGDNEALFAAQLKARLDLITDQIGGWVNDLADTATGSLETVYGQVAAILSVREKEGAQAMAEALLADAAATSETVTRQVQRQVLVAQEWDGVSETIAEQWQTVTETITETITGASSEFQREGETLAATFVRLITSLDAVNGVLENINQSAYALTLSGGDAASELLALFGTVDQFRAMTGSYYQEFFSEQERLANTSEHLTDAFADLGIALPETHAGFRALVEGLDLTTESGRSTFAALMGLAPAFDQVADAAEAAATELARAAAEAAADRAEWQNRLDLLTGRVTQRQLDWQRDLASTTDATTQALINQYYAQLGLADASAAAAEAATARTEQIAQIVAAQRETALNDLTAAQDGLRRAYDAEYAVKQKIIDQFGGYLASLREYRQQLLTGDLSPLDPLARTAEAERQYQDIKRRAAIGNLEAIGQLQGTSQSRLQNMLATYGRNSAEYAAAFYDVQDTLANTESLAERQIGIANDSLAELRSQTAGLIVLNDSVLAVADAIANLRLAQQNVTAMGGSGGGSGGASYSPAQSVAEQWFSTYATSFSPSAETIGWWHNKIASVGAEAALAQFLNPNPSAPRLSALLADPDYAAYVLGLPGHAAGGIASGLFTAGERGTEIMYSPSPVRVLSSGDSRAAVIDGGEVSALLKRAVELLAKVVEGQHADQAQRGAAATATLAELSDLAEKVDAQRRTQRARMAA